MRMKKIVPSETESVNKNIRSSKYGVASVERLCYGLNEAKD